MLLMELHARLIRSNGGIDPIPTTPFTHSFKNMSELRKKIIGFDLDDVLLDFNNAFCLYHNRIYDTNICRSDLTVFEYDNILNCSKKETIKRVVDFYTTPDHLNSVPVAGAIEAI